MPRKAVQHKVKPVVQRKARQIKIKVEPPTPPPTPPPSPAPKACKRREGTRFAGGLLARWLVKYEGDVDATPYHSLRGFVHDLQQRGVPVRKTETVRAFIRRRSNGVRWARKPGCIYTSIESIVREGSTNNILAVCAPKADEPMFTPIQEETDSSCSTDDDSSDDDGGAGPAM
jgi:hypothetical protein